ncbi:hypothetical protein BB558_004127 [Smittium angustum]|uniref:Mitochondrial import inner membrane translocase subunit Tim21 n=1 Tax=Smittium angustum TaxID=133377 RepID=A0A2U1J4A0_SMIAN|nr:hypothetical protein BB558_004127 [Smittium angustum]
MAVLTSFSKPLLLFPKPRFFLPPQFSSQRFNRKTPITLNSSRSFPLNSSRSFPFNSSRSYSSNSQTINKLKSLGLYAVLICVTGVFGFVGYTLYGNLVAENSPTRVYNDSLELCRKDKKLAHYFGPQIVGFGEPTTSRMQRNRSIAHSYGTYKDGRNQLDVKFYIEAKNNPRSGLVPVSDLPNLYFGTVNAKLIQDPQSGQWGYHFLIADIYNLSSLVETHNGKFLPQNPQHNNKQLVVDISKYGFEDLTRYTKPFTSIDLYSSPLYLQEKQIEAQSKRHKFGFLNKKPQTKNSENSSSWFGIFSTSSWTK